MSHKITLSKGNDVKRTKSEQLAALLEKDGWKRETLGGGKSLDQLAQEAIAETAAEGGKKAAETAADPVPAKNKGGKKAA